MKKIPKILHLFWGYDGQEFSRLQALTAFSFAKHNPEFKIYVWVAAKEGEIKDKEFVKLKKIPNLELKFDCLSQYDLSCGSTMVQKSDLFRYYVLYNLGGFWSDFDILFINPIDNLLVSYNKNFHDITAGLCWNQDKGGVMYHSIGFLFSQPGAGIFADIIKQCYKCGKGKEYELYGSPMLGRLFPNYFSAENKYGNIANIVARCLYPVSWQDIDLFFQNYDPSKVFVDKHTIGIHWFYGDERCKKYIANNYNNPESIINKFCSTLGLPLTQK